MVFLPDLEMTSKKEVLGLFVPPRPPREASYSQQN